MKPFYLNLTFKDWQRKIEKIKSFLSPCRLCPRNCQVDRLKEEKGFCRLGSKAVVSSFHPHFGEEKCLVGKGGSGTIFFAHCNLACLYCQNYDISQLDQGREVKKEELVAMMIELQSLGCENINFVTPTPHISSIIEALPLAIKKGLKIPLVYNTSEIGRASCMERV